jgi:Leucine-rich repeat (LRR) protein
MLRDFFQIILIVALSLMFRLISACPSPCICKWKSGKQTVECGGQKLPNIPEGMDHGTQVLNFSHNSITVLQSERFQKMELINLQKIFLSNNELIRINDRAFRGLSNLVELDLSDNMLTSIPTETFQDYSSLMRLSLSGNPIRDLKTSAFKYLSYLTTLELSNCQISVIEDEAFIGMDNLEWLKLDGNRIANIRGSHILPESLNGISLHGNRWICDCKLMDIYGWLTTNSVPMIEEPKCFEPQKLQGHQIKSLQADELACVPTISPTTIYLEIAEGRNISLLCKITAFPEASISWWFQGQILQNDTIIAPNLHLYYYIEEGLDEKRSELFIFNANADDNGTFACVAENSAGRTQANYTIRVIVKEEPIVEEVSFPNEIFLFIIGGAIVICLLTVVCCCIIICKCRKQAQNSSSNRKKKKKKGSKGKEVSFQLPNSQKCVAIANDINSSLVCSKINGNLTITDNNQQEMLLYLGNNTQNISINDMSLQGHCGPQDRNPDLINDAESLRQRNESDMKQHQRDDNEKEKHDNNFSLVPILRPIPARFTAMSTLPRGGSNNGVSRDMYQVDVHLNPGCFIDTNGYPVEYSLTQIPVINQAQVPVNYNYKTLPHNRANKAANSPVVRFSNEAEFITRTSQTFQTYSPDVRYTAEGYPCVDPVNGAMLIDAQNFPSPPDGYKTDNTSSLPTVALLNNQNFCPNSLAMQQQQQPKWPSCLPGYHPQLIAVDTRFQMSPQPLQSPTSQQNPISVTKKCVGAQTSEMCDNNVIHEEEEEEEEDSGENDCNGSSSQTKCRQLKGPLADSPDEGYVGDSHESTDI